MLKKIVALAATAALSFADGNRVDLSLNVFKLKDNSLSPAEVFKDASSIAHYVESKDLSLVRSRTLRGTNRAQMSHAAVEIIPYLGDCTSMPLDSDGKNYEDLKCKPKEEESGYKIFITPLGKEGSPTELKITTHFMDFRGFQTHKIGDQEYSVPMITKDSSDGQYIIKPNEDIVLFLGLKDGKYPMYILLKITKS